MTVVGEVFVGIDLAWSSGMTGLAVVDPTGRVLTSTSVRSDEQIDGWLGGLPGHPVVVAVDAPLVVPNQGGARDGERHLARAYSRYAAAPYTTSRATLGGAEPRAMRLARRHGWATDPTTPVGGGTCVCIEVYPHPALVGLFTLPYRLAYKKGSLASRTEAFRVLADHLETVTELGLATYPRWADMRAMLAGPQPGDLDRWEDEVDAIVCAHLAWLWRYKPGYLTVYGSPAGGYIVAPPPPTHPPAPPAPSLGPARTPQAAVGMPGPPASGRRQAGRQAAGARARDDALTLHALLVERMRAGAGPVTYATAAAQVGRIPNGLGPVLDLLEQHCADRGEPNLAVLVVNAASGQPTKYAHLGQDWAAEQRRCATHAWTSGP